jgi:ABC-type phosphate transport system substrate-binding protein
MRLKKAAIIVTLTVLVWTIPAVATGQGFKVVVNEANPSYTVSKQQLSNIFMKKTGTWSDGQQALPVDQAVSSSTRHGFSKVIFGRDANAIKSYWQRQIFSGRGVPPPEKASDDEVLAFVKANPGAIGYVSSNADVGSGVKVLEIAGK